MLFYTTLLAHCMYSFRFMYLVSQSNRPNQTANLYPRVPSPYLQTPNKTDRTAAGPHFLWNIPHRLL